MCELPGGFSQDVSKCEMLRILQDKFPEFGTCLPEVMRKPMQYKVINISRAQHKVVTIKTWFFPIKLLLICQLGYGMSKNQQG